MFCGPVSLAAFWRRKGGGGGGERRRGEEVVDGLEENLGLVFI